MNDTKVWAFFLGAVILSCANKRLSSMNRNFDALASIVATRSYTFEIYQSGGKWRWRLKADNHEIVANGEGYASRQACENAIGMIKWNAASAEIRHL